MLILIDSSYTSYSESFNRLFSYLLLAVPMIYLYIYCDARLVNFHFASIDNEGPRKEFL